MTRPPASMTATASIPSRQAVVRAVAWGGWLAGAGDLAFALIYYGMKGATADRVLQSIAAGLLGREQAYAGGMGTATVGVGLHFVIALGAAAAFVFAARIWPVLLRRAVASGLLFGGGVWLVMNTVIVPLSALPRGPFPPAGWLPVLAAHLLLVGLPIAWAARRHLGTGQRP